MTLELKMNHYYRSRRRGTVLIVDQYDETDELFRIFGYAFVGRALHGKNLTNYFPNGRAINDIIDDPLDLLEETQKPILYIPKPPRPKIGPHQKIFLETLLELKDEAYEFRIRERISEKLGKRTNVSKLKDISSVVLFKNWAVAQDAGAVEEGFRMDRRLFRITEAGRKILKDVKEYKP